MIYLNLDINTANHLNTIILIINTIYIRKVVKYQCCLL